MSRRLGDWETCVGYFRRAVELDPLNPQLLEAAADTFLNTRDYSASVKICEKLLRINSGDEFALGLEIENYQAMGNLAAARALLPPHPAQTRLLLNAQIDQLTSERRYGEAIAMITPEIPHFTSLALAYERVYLLRALTIAYRCSGNANAARTTATQLQKEARQLYESLPDYNRDDLAVAYALKGEKAKALEIAEELRRTKDAVEAASYPETMATIGVLTGDKEMALAQLAASAKIVGGVSYGNLRFYPLWDPLRNDPRFTSLLATLAPKE